MIVWGPGFVSTAHRHHCVQLVMALRGSLRVRAGPDEEWRTCRAALIRPDASHEVDARDDSILIAFIDAESDLGAALADEATAGITCIDGRRVARWRAALGAKLTDSDVERWVANDLLKRRRPARVDSRVQEVIADVRRRIRSAGDLSLQSLAKSAGLSTSRLMHLFTESVGVPLRPYIRWLRLQLAACELMNGATVSAAAHRAGFSDAAHLTRTFRSMLGTTPSDIALRKRLSRGVRARAAETAPTQPSVATARAGPA